jgi:hypothetical protein
MLFAYLVALALGAGVAGVFLYPVFGGGGDKRMLVLGLGLVCTGLVCAGYSLVQLLRPVPRRTSSPTSIPVTSSQADQSR